MASQPIYQFYVELRDYQPKIWRRFQVVNTVTMARLGYIVMTLFEMQGCHLFNFEVPVEENFQRCVGKYVDNDVNEKIVGLYSAKPELSQLHIELPSEDGFSEFEGRTLDAAQTKVKNVLTEETETVTFSYDYGDGWEVQLVLEQIFEDKELPGKELPRVLEGAGYGIIEDCGGPGGLEEIAKAYKKKKGSQYKEYCEWLGMDDLDLAAFDRDDINFRLKKVPRIYTNSYEYGLEPTKQSMDLLMRKYKN